MVHGQSPLLRASFSPYHTLSCWTSDGLEKLRSTGRRLLKVQLSGFNTQPAGCVRCQETPICPRQLELGRWSPISKIPNRKSILRAAWSSHQRSSGSRSNLTFNVLTARVMDKERKQGDFFKHLMLKVMISSALFHSSLECPRCCPPPCSGTRSPC